METYPQGIKKGEKRGQSGCVMCVCVKSGGDIRGSRIVCDELTCPDVGVAACLHEEEEH